MKEYVVEYTDMATGATSPIDTIKAPEGYTAENYIDDCKANADKEWCDMLERGFVTLTEEVI